jgi:hypothetical protein
MHIALWVVQVLLALAFLMAGVTKLTSSPDELLAMGMTWVSYTPAPLVKVIGVAETLGAIGLVVPAGTRILPWLTPLAAAGIATIMLLAMIAHGTHGEAGAIPVNLVLGGLAAFVAWGRFVKRPIATR